MSASIFSVLQEEMSYMPSRSAEVRKALKKLREIDALKEKTDYNPEELEKLAKETYWKNILDPPDTKAQLDAERKAKQNKRHLEKESKKEAKRLVEKELLKKQQKRDSEEREKHKRLHEEYLKRKAEREAAEENSRREYEENRKAELEKTERDNRFKQQYIDEFAKAVSIYKSPGRAFRKLSLKYHPDKNPENREEAENIQKILGDIRSTYA